MTSPDTPHPHRPNSKTMRRLGASLRALNNNADQGLQGPNTDLGCGFTIALVSNVAMALPTPMASTFMAIDALATAGRFTADWPDEPHRQAIQIDRSHDLANQLTGTAAALKAMIDDAEPDEPVDPDPRDAILNDLLSACCGDPSAIMYAAIQRTLRMPVPPSGVGDQAKLAAAWVHHFIVGRQVAIGL